MNTISKAFKPFLITKSYNAIFACSTVRLPFEPKGWMLEFRKELRSAVEQLQWTYGSMLHAKYGSLNNADFVDTENVLFYNIGAASFKSIAAHIVQFQRLTAENTVKHLSMITSDYKEYPYYYAYQIIPSPSTDHMYQPNEIIAEWKDIKLSRPYYGHKPQQYWQLIKANPDAVSIYAQNAVYEPFGLDIRFKAPQQEQVNLTAIMKPLLDGVICAFHSYKKPLDSAFDTMCTYMNCTPKTLINEEHGILGNEIYVYNYRNSIKWNPNDDRCNSVKLSVQCSSDNSWSFNGRVYRLL